MARIVRNLPDQACTQRACHRATDFFCRFFRACSRQQKRFVLRNILREFPRETVMIQKKICMVGVYGTGKTCLVQQYVQGIFSVKYLSTVGVKIDRKQLKVGDQEVTLMLWDLEGRDGTRDISASYVRGAHGIIYVGDGTRPETVWQIGDLHEIVVKEIGETPSVIALNKVDLKDDWKLSAGDESSVSVPNAHRLKTSAKTGEGVEAAFQWLAEQTVRAAS